MPRVPYGAEKIQPAQEDNLLGGLLCIRPQIRFVRSAAYSQFIQLSPSIL